MPELMPCPFCGSDAKPWPMVLEGDSWIVFCHECKAIGPKDSPTRDAAIAAWNRRHAAAPTSEPTIDAIREAYRAFQAGELTVAQYRAALCLPPPTEGVGLSLCFPARADAPHAPAFQPVNWTLSMDSAIFREALDEAIKANAPMAVPGLGHWQRGEEHESKMTVSNPELGCSLVVNVGRGSLPSAANAKGRDVERWLVQTLQMWPHPNAPRADNEHDYPAYRTKAYRRLFAGDGDTPTIVERK